MRAIIQKVLKSSVTVNSQIVGQINRGYCVLLGIAADDTEEDTRWIINKLLKVRLFNDWNENIEQAGAELLLISQFTLYGKLKGNKLDFHLAMKSESANVLYEHVLSGLRASLQDRVQCGIFGAMMTVDIQNDGRKSHPHLHASFSLTLQPSPLKLTLAYDSAFYSSCFVREALRCLEISGVRVIIFRKWKASTNHEREAAYTLLCSSL